MRSRLFGICGYYSQHVLGLPDQGSQQSYTSRPSNFRLVPVQEVGIPTADRV